MPNKTDIDLPHLLAVARGDARADLVLRDARMVNVFSGTIERCDIAIANGLIAGITRRDATSANETPYDGTDVVDLKGAYLAPGLIDAHVHIESSLCTPPNFAEAVVPRGVTTVVTDPHEIANVAGLPGIRFMIEASRNLPLSVLFAAPSCVPATDLAPGGAVLNAADLATLIASDDVIALAELMNFPGAIQGTDDILAKLKAFQSLPIDGHCPGVRGKQLSAYVAAGVGSDHECTTVDEAQEKLSRGLYILIREATNAQNLAALLPLITPAQSRRICLCTDDRVPADLLDEGSVDAMVRRVITSGIDPIDAIRLATLNTCEWFNLHDRGAIAPGRRADFFVFDDLKAPGARIVFSNGKRVAENGLMLGTPAKTQANTERAGASTASPLIPASVRGRCDVDPPAMNLAVPDAGNRIRVIRSLPDQLITEHVILAPTIIDGVAAADPARDLLKICVAERHSPRHEYAVGFIQGFGLRSGAIAGTIAHDHHNLIAIGASDEALRAAVAAVSAIGGGLVVVDDAGQTLAALSLPMAGLMSQEPIHQVRIAYDKLLAAARSLGATPRDPFMAMSFMGLEVIPDLKITSRGLVDVKTFSIVSLFVE